MPEHASAPIRILLADDHNVVREALKMLIDGEPDMTVIAEAADGTAAVERALSLKPDVIVLDISMPGVNGLQAARTLKKQAPQIAIVTLTRHTEDGYLQELLRSGVSAYVLKQSAARCSMPFGQRPPAASMSIRRWRAV
jgi:DNA-binding NarL/FixJ family response regulator